MTKSDAKKLLKALKKSSKREFRLVRDISDGSYEVMDVKAGVAMEDTESKY